MMAKTIRPRRSPFVASIIERANNDILIALARGPDAVLRHWQFPRGRARPDESPEAAMRRVARELLGILVEVIVGQPPVPARIDGEEVEVRFFFCGVADGEPRPEQFVELAWIHKAHLREYEFDAVSKPVVDWMLATQT
jgi:8-oxo-dGTP pyrophosphatase MutT (NUDIX family)